MLRKNLNIVILVMCLGAFGAFAGENSCGNINLHLYGRLGRMLDTMIERHLAATDIDYLTAPFATENELEGFWRTEFWGKFMHSAEPLAGYSGNARLRAVIDRGVERILAAQQSDGYIGNYPSDRRFAAGNGWDLWGIKYTLMGLIHHYDATGKASALTAAKRLLDYVIGEIGPDGCRQRSISAVGFCAGQPSLSILEPVMWLYQRTQESRYLAFADYIVREMEDEKVGPRLIALCEVPVWRRNDPSSDKIVWNSACNRLKAYEMMSCYQGLLEYYEVTNRKDCLKAVIKAAESIIADEINLAGGSCSGEHWFHGVVKQHRANIEQQETCVTITWMRLVEKLVRLTDDPKWADALERTFFNAYLAALKPDGTAFACYTPLSGYRSEGQHHCRMHTNCCNANGARGFLSFLRAAVRVADDGALVVDQYASSIVSAKLKDGRDFGFDVYSLYPWDGKIRLTSRTAGSCKVRLRIPACVTEPKVRVNGAEIAAVKTGYLTLDRTWTPGDAVEITFGLPVVAHAQFHHIAFTRGPILLARDAQDSTTDVNEVVRDEIKDGAIVPGATLARSCDPAVPLTVCIPLFVGAHSENPEAARPDQVRFRDYASAGAAWRPSAYYRTWFELQYRPWE